MAQNLFAACRENGQLVGKRVRLNRNVQQAVEDIFAQQEYQFRSGVTDEINFNGSWKPEENEVLTLDVPSEAQVLINTIEASPVSIPDIHAAKFEQENIKALFTGTSIHGATTVLVQQFTAGQVLSRKFTLLFDDNTFRQLLDPAFTLDTSLTCIVEDGKLKFKSFHKMRAVVNLVEAYKAATDREMWAFAAHATLEIGDQSGFIKMADQTTRKLIHAISHEGILDNYDAASIQGAAKAVGINVAASNNKIVMPTQRDEVKNLLRFLDDGLYTAALSGQRYITNSKRPV